MLVPNLVWRSGRAAVSAVGFLADLGSTIIPLTFFTSRIHQEHVRLASMTALARLIPLGALTPAQLEAQMEESLPVIHTVAARRFQLGSP